MFFRSRWEANYARYLRHTGKGFEYEGDRFIITLVDGSQHAYTPDFLVTNRRYVEIKGWLRDDKRQGEVLAAARTQLPLPLRVIRGTDYRAIEARWASRIPHWEYSGDPHPSLPKRRCPICDKEVTSANRRTRYCSLQCAIEDKRKPKEARPCPVCGIILHFAPHEARRECCSRACADTLKRKH